MVVLDAAVQGSRHCDGSPEAYVEVMRGTPLLIQLFLIYYGLPQVGIRLNAYCRRDSRASA